MNLLLDSIVKNANNLFDNITVLYKADVEYASSYALLKTRHENVLFRPEKNFRQDLLSLLDPYYTATCFMVDDAVIHGDLSTSKGLIEYLCDWSLGCFSLRLGLNCNYSHPADLHYSLGEYEDMGLAISFDYTKQNGDFAYPLSTDGHIFQTTLLITMLNEIVFNNPNTLEANLQQYKHANILPKKVICFKESKLVSIPVNLVNDTFNNRHGLEFYMSEIELNNKYLYGEIIDLDALDFSGINGPHKEIKYIFKKV